MTGFDDIMREQQPGDELLEELKAAAFEVLLLNPGCDESDWASILVEQYGSEVVDAYGSDPQEAFASLADLWESPYFDEASGLEQDFKAWANALYTQESIDMYYHFTERLKAQQEENNKATGQYCDPEDTPRFEELRQQLKDALEAGKKHQ